VSPTGPLVLVTGASGFVGGALARRLSDAGGRLRCQYRRAVPPENLRRLEGEGAELVRLDMSAGGFEERRKALDALTAGVDRVYHVAARASDWGPAELFDAVNRRTTVELLEAASRSGVRRFVFVSSLSVQGFGGHRNSTEEGPFHPLIHPYQRSKKAAEEALLAGNPDTMECCILRPGNVYGPGDTTMLYPMFDAMDKGRMGTIAGGRRLTCPVYIDDLTAALVAAGDRPGVDGEAFNITGGEEVSWREFLDAAAAALDVRRPRINLSAGTARVLAAILTALWRAAGARRAPPLTAYRVEHLARDFHFDIAKARRRLGYEPRIPYPEGLRRTAAAYRADRSSRNPT